jgi:hypothetical protein
VEKLVYAVWKRPSEDDASLAARLLGEAAPRLRARSERLRVSVVDAIRWSIWGSCCATGPKPATRGCGVRRSVR